MLRAVQLGQDNVREQTFFPNVIFTEDVKLFRFTLQHYCGSNSLHENVVTLCMMENIVCALLKTNYEYSEFATQYLIDTDIISYQNSKKL